MFIIDKKLDQNPVPLRSEEVLKKKRWTVVIPPHISNPQHSYPLYQKQYLI